MPLTCQLIDNQQLWEQYVLSRPEANFLQSANWAEFQQALGKKVFLIGVFDNQQQVGAMLAVKENAKRGNYLAIAGGPLLDWQQLTDQQLKEVFGYLKKLAKQERKNFH